MGKTNIDFQGEWPEILQVEVEDLIQQYDPLTNGVPADEAASTKASSDAAATNRIAKDRMPIKGSTQENGASRKRFSEAARWIAQCNPAPTGPLYAIGRPGTDDQERMGPVLATSGEELLDKLRALLSATDATECRQTEEDQA